MHDIFLNDLYFLIHKKLDFMKGKTYLKQLTGKRLQKS